jgi:hypothetical protein
MVLILEARTNHEVADVLKAIGHNFLEWADRLMSKALEPTRR